jgi:hypothetical protein
MKNILFTIDDDGMTGVISAGVARYNLRLAGEVVNNLSFSFIPPLEADDCS